MTATVLSSAIILTKAQRGVLGPEYGLFTTQLYLCLSNPVQYFDTQKREEDSNRNTPNPQS